MSEQRQRMQQLADAEGRKWWSEREAKAEKALAAALHKRMEAQRAQIHAFKLEQSKWEHELQLRISKYAHDRKLLSEHNIELQETLTAMDEKHAKLQHEMDSLIVHSIELEGQLRDAQSNEQQVADLRAQNLDMQQRMMTLESAREAEVAAALKLQENNQTDLIEVLERRMEEVVRENGQLRDTIKRYTNRQPRRSFIESGGDLNTMMRRHSDRGAETEDAEYLLYRLAEMEKWCKEKDQTILSLKSMLERHETMSEERVRQVQAKYDQVKAINIALQKNVFASLKSGAGDSSQQL